jgi:hypothetical protein
MRKRRWLEASADAIVSEDIASKDEVTVALTALQRFTANPPTPTGEPLWNR